MKYVGVGGRKGLVLFASVCQCLQMRLQLVEKCKRLGANGAAEEDIPNLLFT